jgi:stage II sporulation protein D
LLGYWFYRRKVAAAVAATRGLALTYLGQLIDPVYHAASGGQTEDAVEVWGRPVPYLRSVPSPWEEDSPQNRVTVTLPVAEVARRLGLVLKPGQPLSLRAVAYTASGRVKSISANGKLFSGPQFRQLLGLNSTLFTWEQSGSSFTFKSRGYGHGVGMSQYGAGGLARRGKTFREILTHYYPGTELTPLEAILLP